MLLHDEREKLRELVIKAGMPDVLPRIDALVVGTPCTECVNYDDPDRWCHWWHDAVPADHVEKGCESWSRIPF